MFLLGITDEEIEHALLNQDYSVISKHLYRVQKLASLYYQFRHHLETNVDESNPLMLLKKFYRIASFKALFNANPKRAIVDVLGRIVLV
jgi:CRISPR-associated endonuclease Csn1